MSFAPDTPGYGWSDAMPKSDPTAEDYARLLERVRGALKLERFALYGTATGAQIAIEYAKLFPDQVSFLVLDNAAHFTDAERDDITAGYFPDLQPDPFGSHLTKIWSIAPRPRGVFPLEQTR